MQLRVVLLDRLVPRTVLAVWVDQVGGVLDEGNALARFLQDGEGFLFAAGIALDDAVVAALVLVALRRERRHALQPRHHQSDVPVDPVVSFRSFGEVNSVAVLAAVVARFLDVAFRALVQGHEARGLDGIQVGGSGVVVTDINVGGTPLQKKTFLRLDHALRHVHHVVDRHRRDAG